MSLENLITDRTLEDVSRVRFLAGKAWQDMTAEERAEWISPMKGSYNYTDLNRVEEAVSYVAERLRECNYLSFQPFTRSWSVGQIPNESDLARYFNNVATLRSAIEVWEKTPSAPSSVNGFDESKANDLEQILVDVDQILNYIKDAWLFSGDLYSGEVN